VIWVFGLIPILDFIVGVDKRNPSPEDDAALTEKFEFRLITWLCVPVQLGVLAWALWAFTTRTLTPLEIVGFTLAVGVSNGAMGINVAHELVHRDSKFERRLGNILLWTVCYMHWGIEHVYGHHAHVATPKDPATSRLGESYYSFWPRTVKGTFLSAWEIELRRLARMKKPVWSFSNRVLIGVVYEAALALGVLAVFGPRTMAFFLAQAVIAFSLLEAVNYLEHYGLMRKTVGENKYEQVTPVHSWNASNWMTNLFLFHLQRHSDHHAAPGRRYQILRHFDESPQLPTGYAGMVLLALVPPLWRRVMDPKVKAAMAGLA
jgi:alkane 1-monooxygenase